MSGYHPYPAYKDSGVEWLGEVPEHWDIRQVKKFADFRTGWTPPTGTGRYFEGDNLWANISDLGPKTIWDTRKRISNEAVALASIPLSPAGSLLFSFKLSIGLVSLAGTDLYTNEAIATFLPSTRADLRYLYYALPIFVVQNANENIYGAKLLNQELIRSARIALPSRHEQEDIAAFLDRETSRIDAAIDR